MSNVTISKLSDGTNIGYIAPQSYFECSTAAATAAKTATSPDSVVFSNISLSRGTTVFVKFTNENTADSPTLQIGNSTAKSISGSATWSAGSVVSFTYDGTNWIQGSGDSSSGGDVMTVELTVDDETYVITADKTYAEITAAISAGKVVRASISDFDMYLEYQGSGIDDGALNFLGFIPEGERSTSPVLDTNTSIGQIFVTCTSSNNVDSWKIVTRYFAAPGDTYIGSETTPIYWSADHFNTVPWSLPTATVGSTTQPVYWDGSSVAATSLATVASSGSYNDLTDQPTVIVTADISNNPQLFSNLMDLGVTTEPAPWLSMFSTALVGALESGAATKFADIITNSKQGIFRIKCKNTTVNVDAEFNFPLDLHLSTTSTDNPAVYTLTGQMGSSNSNRTYPRTFYVAIIIAFASSTPIVQQILLSTSNAEEFIDTVFDDSLAAGWVLTRAHGGTGLYDSSASWYDSTVLHPHFEVSTNGLTFNCYYVGPLPYTVSSVSDALACDEVKYALKQPVPVYDTVSGLQVFTGLANITEISNSTGLQIIFADATTFSSLVVNGIQGVLVYDGTETYPLYLDSILVNTPWYMRYSGNSLKILQNTLGSASIGSTTQPVYWTGSGFSTVSSTFVTSISSSSTNAQYPSAKAVYDLFTSITDADNISY